eukprot:2388196-Lingulodinium_polyedra.AAC.1
MLRPLQSTLQCNDACPMAPMGRDVARRPHGTRELGGPMFGACLDMLRKGRGHGLEPDLHFGCGAIQ